MFTESTARLLPSDNSFATMSSTTTSQQAPVCPDCGCKKTVKKGKRRNRLQILQVFRCTECFTVAVEIPVFLTNGDIDYYRQRGFDLGFKNNNIITGHIDFLQIRNGRIHLLDYKPEARKETHAHVQLTIYALALARRTGLQLKSFKCGWFDEKDYFEFFPLKGVYKRRMIRKDEVIPVL